MYPDTIQPLCRISHSRPHNFMHSFPYLMASRKALDPTARARTIRANEAGERVEPFWPLKSCARPFLHPEPATQQHIVNRCAAYLAFCLQCYPWKRKVRHEMNDLHHLHSFLPSRKGKYVQRYSTGTGEQERWDKLCIRAPSAVEAAKLLCESNIASME